MDILERIIREAVTKSKDGRIDQDDFLNHCASATRYSLFTPQEAAIIFHFAGNAGSKKRLSLLDFGSLLDPRWKPSLSSGTSALGVTPQQGASTQDFMSGFLHSVYNFALGGIAGSFGATMVYPIDLGTF